MNKLSIILTVTMISSLSLVGEIDKMPSEFFHEDYRNYPADYFYNFRIYYDAGKANIEHCKKIIKEDVNYKYCKEDMLYVILFHEYRFSVKSKENAKVARDIRYDLIRCINKHDYIPECWYRIDSYINCAIEQFEIFDKS